MRRVLASAILLVPLLGAAPGEGRLMLVLCSPGSPGSTVEAQPTLDGFVAAAAKAAGWPAASLEAVYFENVETGRQRLAQSDAALALVSPPFFFEFAQSLSLQPRLEALSEAGPGEEYSLVAGKGLAPSPSSLSGWEITGAPGFSPAFVRQVVLGDWGNLPPDVHITFTARPLSALRRSASGEKVAVLLDREGTRALGTLPFASSLEVIHKSRQVPAGLLCVVPNRLPPARAEALERALLGLKDSETGREVLKSIRLSGFARLEAGRMKSLTSLSPSPEKARP